MPKIKKKKILILFGGKSKEHEISVLSVKNIAKALSKNKYNPTFVGITKDGIWLEIKCAQILDNSYSRVSKEDSDTEVSFSFTKKAFCFERQERKRWQRFDVAFPVLHGENGEDGTMQGLFEIMEIPYVGCGVLSSAVCMDKEVTKKILSQANLPTTRHITLNKKQEGKKVTYKEAAKELGSTLYVKPSRSGSSLGVSRVEKEEDFEKALNKAFLEDSKVLIEEAVVGREIECAVLGNIKLKVSTPGEVVTDTDFYTYEEKYSSSSNAKMIIPAFLNKRIAKNAQELAEKAYVALSCRGLARVDLFLTKENKLIVNEINTMPGFTDKSMYPVLLENGGITYEKLLDQLISLAKKQK